MEINSLKQRLLYLQEHMNSRSAQDGNNDLNQQIEVATLAKENYEEYSFPGGNPQHDKATSAVSTMFCRTININQQQHLPMKCILGLCCDCPSYVHHGVELKTSNSPEYMIHYQHYVMRNICKIHKDFPNDFSECPVCSLLPQEEHAKTYQKKFCTCTTTTIGIFLIITSLSC